MKFEYEFTRKGIVKLAAGVLFLFIISFSSFAVGVTMTYPVAHKAGFNVGYFEALNDVTDKTGITFEWEELGDGRYRIVAYYEGGLLAEGITEVHLWIEHRRDGKLLSLEYGAGTLTTIGKNWIEQQISGTINASEQALYLADSNDAGSPSAAWTELPTEITANGLERTTGAYTSTGDGTWNVTDTKSVTGTQSTQLWGIHWKTYADAPDNNLLAADSGPAQKNCVDGDTLKETWQITVT